MAPPVTAAKVALSLASWRAASSVEAAAVVAAITIFARV